jgi:hypothetical protein
VADQKFKAILELSIDDREYKLALSQIPKSADAAAASVRGIGQAINLSVFKELGTIAVNAIGSIVSAIVDLGMRGADVDDVATSFSILAAKTGDTGDAMLGKLREGVIGTLSDFDLMTLANKTLGSGLIKSAEDMGTLAAGARALAKATGETTVQAFDTLTSAMASGRTAKLKQIGLFVDSKVAVENYAAAHQKAVADMTDADRAQALVGASLAALRGRLKDIVPDAADFGELISQAKTRIANFRDELSVAVSVSGVFRAAMVALGDGVTKAFGANQKESVRGILSMLENFAIIMVDVGRVAVAVAEFISVGFQSVKAVMNAFFEIVFGGVKGFSDFLRVAVEAGAKLPGVGSQFQAISAQLQATGDIAGSLALNFGDLKRSQEASAVALQDGFGKVRGVLAGVGAAMVTARIASQETATAHSTSMGSMSADTAAAATRTVEEAKKIADVYRSLSEEIFLATQSGMSRRLAEIGFAEQKEIDGIRNLKTITLVEMDARILLVNEKYRQLAAAAILAGDQIAQKEAELQNKITVGQQTGIDARLTQLAFAHARELEQLAVLTGGYNERYMKLAALLDGVYTQMTETAKGHYADVTLAAAAAGFQTRAELQVTADQSLRLYREMLASGLYTTGELQKQWDVMENAKREASGKTKEFQLTSAEAIVQGTIQIFALLGKKHKAAAIAGAIISTYQAIAKSLASAPFPANIALAAGAAAAGWAQVNAIRKSDEGWSIGTPGMDFADFGPMSLQTLHNEEAVIPRGGGHVLAGEIADSMPEDGLSVQFLGRIAAGIDALPLEIRKGFRNALLLDTA